VMLESLRTAAHNSMAGYALAMFDLSKWKRIFTGERSALPIAKVVLKNLATRVRSRVADSIGTRADASFVKGPMTEPRGIMRELQRKGVHALLIYGAYDVGLDILTAHFGKRGRRLSRFLPVRAAVMDDIDHALFNSESFGKVIDLCAGLIEGLREEAPVKAAHLAYAAVDARVGGDSEVQTGDGVAGA
jgi:hypothetical protein